MGYGEPRRAVGRPRTGTAKTGAERVAAHVARHSLVEWRQCADPKRRARLEKKPQAWITHYGADAFFRKLDRPHKEIIDGCMYAHETGGRLVVGAERGVGKSTVFDWMALYFSLTGLRAFPVVLPWDAPMMAEAFEIWKAALCDNDRLMADYPEICAPFQQSQGIAQRMAAQHWQGGPHDGEPCRARLQVGSGRIMLPDCRGGIGGKTINGNPRGLKLPLADGRILRPDLVLIDEPQDDEVAASPQLVNKTSRKINGAVAGMGQGGGSIPILMAGNFIRVDDVMDMYAKDANWKAVRVACIESWPAGWANRGPAYKLWAEWWEMFRDTVDGQAKARAFYKQHKAAMVQGMAISAPNVYREHVSRYLPDVLCAAMKRYWQDGHESFMAERQQSPVDPVAEAQVRVTPDMIVKRAIGPARGTAPDGTIRIVGGADINPGISGRLGARITWAAAAFQMHQSECVMAYGIHKLDMPADPTPSQQVTCVYNGLTAVRMMLGGIGAEVLVYDAKGWYNSGVTRGQALRYATVPVPGTQCAAMPAEGWPHHAYRPTHKTAVRALECCHVAQDRVEHQTVRWIAWDVDWFNLQQLRAWMASPGAPGSCILYTGHHEAEFLNQATTRAFIGMVQKHSGPVYDWARQPGNDDYGDCLAMCRVGAAYCGIGTGGQIEQPSQRKKYSQKDFNR